LEDALVGAWDAARDVYIFDAHQPLTTVRTGI
jgi:hypothetical protein